MRYETLTEACHAWVQEFNSIPQSVLEKLIQFEGFESVNEITPPSKYDRVYVYDKQEHGEIIKTCCGRDGNKYRIELDNGQKIYRLAEDFEVERESYLPMWGTMWSFGDIIDEDWLKGEFGTNGLQIMADCGFRIYEQEDYGYVFGIDGAGFDFYEAFWIPLYKARGLRWHDRDDTVKEVA
jgi:hypothetical protein